jgi:hypothetical protein
MGGAHTGYTRRNLPYTRRTFLRLNYIDITKNTYVLSLRVTEIIAREFWKNENCCIFIDYQMQIKTRRNL